MGWEGLLAAQEQFLEAVQISRVLPFHSAEACQGNASQVVSPCDTCPGACSTTAKTGGYAPPDSYFPKGLHPPRRGGKRVSAEALSAGIRYVPVRTAASCGCAG